MESGCAKLFSITNDDGSRGWRPALRAETRRGGGSARSRWLRDENDVGWKAPNQLFNAGGISGNDNGGMMGVNRREGAVGGGASGIANKYGDKAFKVGGNAVKAADIFRDPKQFFPIKETHVTAEVDGEKIAENDVAESEMEVDPDRKRQREDVVVSRKN